jgi:hypothetical protein
MGHRRPSPLIESGKESDGSALRSPCLYGNLFAMKTIVLNIATAFFDA